LFAPDFDHPVIGRPRLPVSPCRGKEPAAFENIPALIHASSFLGGRHRVDFGKLGKQTEFFHLSVVGEEDKKNWL